MSRVAASICLAISIAHAATLATAKAPNVEEILSSTPWDGQCASIINLKISTKYLEFARAAQEVIAGGRNATLSCPSWFAIGIHASREVGLGELLLESIKEILDHDGSYAQLRDKIFIASSILVRAGHPGVFFAQRCGWTGICWDDIAIFIRRAFAFWKHTPRMSTRETLRTIVRTGLNLLEHGNRLIFEHIGGAFEAYLSWRRTRCTKGRSIEPLQVINEFRLSPSKFRVGDALPSAGATDPIKARELYESVSQDLENANEDQRSLLEGFRCVDILVVAFACWEKAGVIFRLEGNSSHQHWVQFGNHLVAWCEQAEAVVPAFRPAGAAQKYSGQLDSSIMHPLPGEVSRERFSKLVTPFVHLGFSPRPWMLAEYPGFMDLDWGCFGDRYSPILAAFGHVYASGPGSLWPLPSADPLNNEQADTDATD